MSSNIDQPPISEQEVDSAPYRDMRIVSAAQGIAAVMEARPPQAKKVEDQDSEDKPSGTSINVGLLL